MTRSRMTGSDEFDGFLCKFSHAFLHEGRFPANPSGPVIPSARASPSFMPPTGATLVPEVSGGEGCFSWLPKSGQTLMSRASSVPG